MLTPGKADGKSLTNFCSFSVRVKFKARSCLTFHTCRTRKVRVCSGFKGVKTEPPNEHSANAAGRSAGAPGETRGVGGPTGEPRAVSHRQRFSLVGNTRFEKQGL